jgi:hypothetical protein
MVSLTSAEIQRAGDFIRRNGRTIDIARFSMHFGPDADKRAAARDAVIQCLKTYQNADGGFGRGLESDFTLPASSATATSIALGLIEEVQAVSCGAPTPNLVTALLGPAIHFLEDTFDPVRPGWTAVPREVNNHPHAVWWHFDEAKGMTAIDRNWGNPSAELIGYLYKHRHLVSRLDVDSLVDHACAYLLAKSSFPSEHEVFCFIAMHDLLSMEKRRLMEPKLKEAVHSLVRTDLAEWTQYVPRPHHFAKNPSLAQLFGFDPQVMEPDLDDLATAIKQDEGLWPVWNWGQYPEDWAKSKSRWAGLLTLRSLLVLRSFGRNPAFDIHIT